MADPIQPISPVPSLADIYKVSGHDHDPDIDLDMQMPEKPKEEAKPAPEPKVETPPPAPTHSRRTLKLAADLGLTEAEVSAMSKDDLDDEIYHRTRLALSSKQEAPKPAPTPTKTEDDDKLDLGVDENGVPYKEEDLHPVLVKQLKAQAKVQKALDAKIAAFEAKSQAQEKERQMEPVYRAYDEAFDKLSDQYGGIFGKGRLTNMKVGSPAHTLRMMIAGQAKPKGLEDIETALADVVAAFYGPLKGQTQPAPTPPPAKAQPRENGRFAKPTAEDYAQAVSPRPTSRIPTELPDGPEKAARTLAAGLKHLYGVTTDEDSNGFPN